MVTYSIEQLKDLYGKLPMEIKEIITSDDTQESIYKALEEQGILDKRAGLISNLIRDVLFGFLPPKDFIESLKKEVGLDDDTAKKIAQEINRFIFSPVKAALDNLYKTEPESNVVNNPESVEADLTIPKPQEKKPDKSNPYLEQIE